MILYRKTVLETWPSSRRIKDLCSSKCPVESHGTNSDERYFFYPTHFFIYIRSTPHPVTVTTRIITFLVGNPYKPSFATVTGWGVDPTYTTHQLNVRAKYPHTWTIWAEIRGVFFQNIVDFGASWKALPRCSMYGWFTYIRWKMAALKGKCR